MDLEFGSEYNDFIKEVQDFCKEYGNATITTNNDKKFEMHESLKNMVGMVGSRTSSKVE